MAVMHHAAVAEVAPIASTHSLFLSLCLSSLVFSICCLSLALMCSCRSGEGLVKASTGAHVLSAIMCVCVCVCVCVCCVHSVEILK
jgi:hypothetical protein